MTDIEWEGQPLPQVGAILHFDSGLSYDGDEIKAGSKHWKLDGTCVLMGAQRALGVMHTLSKPGLKAVFLPGEGIFPFDKVEDETSGVRYGDYLGLIPLDREVSWTPGLPWARINKSQARYVRVVGYGRWRRNDEIWLDGIQRRVRINLADTHGDRLDLDWWADENQHLSALRNNSGGPLLWGHRPGDFEAIAFSRERKMRNERIKQVASWIGDVRDGWLSGVFGDQNGSEAHGFIEWRELQVEAASGTHGVPGAYEEIAVPPTAQTARVTVSATPGLRLQMGLAQGEGHESLLTRLAEDNRAAGRFLVRPAGEADFRLDGSTNLMVGVAPVRSAPENASAVIAQLCVRFAA